MTLRQMTADISEKWFVIVNPVAGSGRGLIDLPKISKLIRDNDIPYELVFSQHKHHPTELTVRAVNAGYRRIIVIGGDREKRSASDPDYAARCEKHHFLPGKEYTFFTLKPLGEEAGKGNAAPLIRELSMLHEGNPGSLLAQSLERQYGDDADAGIYLNALLPQHTAEKALAYLFAEQGLLGEGLLVKLATDLSLDLAYLEKTLAENSHPVSFSQRYLL